MRSGDARLTTLQRAGAGAEGKEEEGGQGQGTDDQRHAGRGGGNIPRRRFVGRGAGVLAGCGRRGGEEGRVGHWAVGCAQGM